MPAGCLACCRKGVMTMRMATVKCDLCGKEFQKPQIEMSKHNFCCRSHFYEWNSKRISDYNRADNPMNKPGGVLASRIKRGNVQRGQGKGKTYRKYLGRHEHRYIAEMKLGRPLRTGEVVHHIDGNIKNNAPENLMVLPSQTEHCRLHGFGKKKEGDVNDSNQ